MQPLLFKTQYFPLSDLHSPYRNIKRTLRYPKGKHWKIVIKSIERFRLTMQMGYN